MDRGDEYISKEGKIQIASDKNFEQMLTDTYYPENANQIDYERSSHTREYGIYQNQKLTVDRDVRQKNFSFTVDSNVTWFNL